MNEENLSRPFRTQDLAAYNEGSIVSRALVKSDAGSITLFAFAQGEQLSPHSAPYDALIQLLDGYAIVTIGADEHKVEAGQAIILPANIPHAVRAPENMKMLLVMIKEKSETKPS